MKLMLLTLVLSADAASLLCLSWWLPSVLPAGPAFAAIGLLALHSATAVAWPLARAWHAEWRARRARRVWRKPRYGLRNAAFGTQNGLSTAARETLKS